MTTSISQAQTKNEHATATSKACVAAPRPHAAPLRPKRPRQSTPTKKAIPARRATKTSKILELLKRPDGVTLKELMKAVGWQAHSVRGFLSGTVGKKMGTPVESSRRADCQRSYRLPSK